MNGSMKLLVISTVHFTQGNIHVDCSIWTLKLRRSFCFIVLDH